MIRSSWMGLALAGLAWGCGGDPATGGAATTSTVSSGATTTSAGGAGAGGSGTGGSGPQCGVTEHLCGGVCAGNTPVTGCYGSASCVACPSSAHGASTCSSQGACVITCDAGYQKSGNQCICNSQCCADSDCGAGATCQSGTCVDPPPACDAAQCTIECTVKNGAACIGVCLGGNCTCLC